MWCPVGYTMFTEIYYDTMGLGQRFADNTTYSRHFRLRDDVVGNDASEVDARQLHAMLTTDSERKLAYAQAQLFHAWIIDSLLSLYDPLVCSPAGQLLRVDHALLGHENNLCDVGWTDMHVPDELRELCAALAFQSHGDSIWLGFNTLRIPAGIVSSEWASVRDGDDTTRMEAARQFEGWSLCFPDENIPDDPETLLGELGFDVEALGEGATSSESNAKSGFRFITTCVLNTYPGGKVDTWTETERRLGISRRSIIRALKDCGQDWWAKAGQK